MPDLYDSWREKVAAGKKMRPLGSVSFRALAIITVLGSVFCLYMAVELARLFFTGEAGPLAPEDPAAMTAACVFIPFWLVLSLRAAWLPLLFSRLHFAPDYMDFWDWRGRKRRIYYSDILILTWKSPHRTASRWSIRLFYRNRDTLRSAWVNLASESGWKAGLAEAVREVLVARGALKVLGPEERGAANLDAVWVRPEMPGFETGEYLLSMGKRLTPLLAGLAALAIAGGILFLIFYVEKESLKGGWPALWVGGICGLFGFASVFSWVKENTIDRGRTIVAVEWEAGGMGVRTGDGAVDWLPWESIARATAPADPGGAAAEIFTSGDEPKYNLTLSDNEDSIAFLKALDENVGIEWVGF